MLSQLRMPMGVRRRKGAGEASSEICANWRAALVGRCGCGVSARCAAAAVAVGLAHGGGLDCELLLLRLLRSSMASVRRTVGTPPPALFHGGRQFAAR